MCYVVAIAGDSCSVCKDERKEIIADLNKKVHNRLHGVDEDEEDAVSHYIKY